MSDDVDKVEVWKAIIEVQKHFNTIEMTIRNIFVTLVVAIVAGIGLSLKEGEHLTILGSIVPLAAMLSLVAAFVTWLFYFMDRYWYHKLLVGSVQEAIALEKLIMVEPGVPVTLTKRIGGASPINVQFIPKLLRRVLWLLITEKKFIPDGRVHSDGKISLFYKSLILMFALLALSSFFFHSSSTAKL